MPQNKKARQVVARHTQHGVDRATAKKRQVIASIGTERCYTQALSNYFEWCALNDIHPDLHANLRILINFLEERSEWIKQKTLDQERQALQLVYKQKLPYVRSLKASIYEKRSYTYDQVMAIISAQTERNSLTTLLSFFSGLRAHEPATLLPREERAPSSHRHWDRRRFLGSSEYRLYTVVGKGGLIREVAIPKWLTDKLESLRIPPTNVRDRGINYIANYNIGFGQAWSQSFTSASKKVLGYSTGGHGLRHSYAKWRLNSLITALEVDQSLAEKDRVNEEALLLISQELGHFRLNIVFCYLR